MKHYRYAPLLAAGWFVVASLGKILSYFDMPSSSVNGNPTTALSSNDLALDEVAGVERKTVAGLADSAQIRQSVAVKAVSTVCGGYYGYISVGGRNICLQSTDTTGGSLSYNYGYIFNSSAYNSYNSYIFAHNSAGLFGGLKDLGVGARFAVNAGGQVVNYQISGKVVYCDYSNPAYPCSNYSEPVLDMWHVIWPGREGADISLMTCAGQGIGGGDATHRLVVYARKVG